MMTRTRRAWTWLRWQLPLKSVCIPGYMAAFMTGYFVLLRHPLFPVRVMPVQALDRWIGFHAWAIVPYLSLWLYVSLAPALLHDYRQTRRYLSAVIVTSLVGFGIFLFWPTASPAFALDWPAYPSVAWLKSADAAGNACPSLHVAFSVLTAAWLARLAHELDAPAWLHACNLVWCALIVWSTMALRQHVALDVEAGALLGGGVAWLHLARWPQRRPDNGRASVRRDG